MDKNVELAFESLRLSTNLFVSLSTGVLALGVTFSKDLLGGIPEAASLWLILSATVFILSIVFGMLVNMALTGTLEQEPGSEQVPISTRNENIKFLSGSQIVLFGLGLLLLAGFAVHARLTDLPKEQTWVAEANDGTSDFGVYESRAKCLAAIPDQSKYRCKVNVK